MGTGLGAPSADGGPSKRSSQPRCMGAWAAWAPYSWYIIFRQLSGVIVMLPRNLPLPLVLVLVVVHPPDFFLAFSFFFRSAAARTRKSSLPAMLCLSTTGQGGCEHVGARHPRQCRAAVAAGAGANEAGRMHQLCLRRLFQLELVRTSAWDAEHSATDDVRRVLYSCTGEI